MLRPTSCALLITAALFTNFCWVTPSYAFCPQNSDATPRTPIELNDKGEFVPDWAKGAIWYQVFPERFRDGDSSNNPTLADITGADPAEPAKMWQIHPWGSDWYKKQPYELANGEPELWKHLLRRRYGGDLQGIIDKLDYIKHTGFNAIYLNPVFDSPSLHKYDGASFHHIDPNFGPDPEGDRKLIATENPLDPKTWVWTKADELALELIKQAKQRGIRIIFDGVFNHMGINSFAFKHLEQHQQRSPYKEWFTVNQFRSDTTPFDYQGWFGVASLPEFAEDANGLAQGPRDYVFAATERWMNPKGMGKQYGIDGWRLDVAFCIAHGFWKDWRTHVKRLNAEAYITAELVMPPEQVQPYMQGDEFDGEMNYNFAFAAAEFLFNPAPDNITATEFDKRLRDMRNLYPKGVAYVTQNLFGSHDANRLGSHIVNRGIGNFRNWGDYFQLSQAANNPQYQVRKPNADEIALQKLFVILQMTYVGAPMVYYGDEVGMWGANDPDDRKPMIWPDIVYEDEATNADGSIRKADKVSVNADLYQHYRHLIAIRQSLPALQRGDFTTLLTDDDNGIYGFERRLAQQQVRVIFNNSNHAQTITLPAKQHTWRDTLSQLPVSQQADLMQIQIPAKWAGILLAE